MQIVIDMPDLTYESIMKYQSIKEVGADFIRQGTALPKGHGDLVDRSELIRVLETEIMCTEDTRRRATLNYVLCVLIGNVPTVILADK